MNLNELREAMATEATEENKKLKEENAKLRKQFSALNETYKAYMASLGNDCGALSNRCFVLTHGAMCCFCELKLYECPHALTDMEKIKLGEKWMEESKNAEN